MAKIEDKYLVVISFDSLGSEDLEELKNLPNFKYVMSNGALITKVKSIYPTLTYPIHTTLITGRYPKDHGIVNNTLIQPGRQSPDWYWYEKYIKGETLLKLAKKKGYKTASLLWPVTAKGNIDYNLPEIFPNRPWKKQIVTSLTAGSPLMLMNLQRKFGYIRKGLQQPALDMFASYSASYIIEKHKPNLTMIHFTDVDTNRHIYGYNSKEAKMALERYDKRLGEIITALKKTELWNKCTLVALSDHSQIDVSKSIRLNILFKDAGLIEVDEKGNISNWKAYLKTCEGSSYIYLKNKEDSVVKNRVMNVLKEFMENNRSGIETIYSAKEAEALGADPNCFLMLEAKRGYHFVEFIEGQIIDEPKNELKACHGYSPDKNKYETIFMAYGVGVKKSVIIENEHIINVAPTLAKFLDMEFEETTGRIIEEIFD